VFSAATTPLPWTIDPPTIAARQALQILSIAFSPQGVSP
jgi:hypothetical protein